MRSAIFTVPLKPTTSRNRPASVTLDVSIVSHHALKSASAYFRIFVRVQSLTSPTLDSIRPNETPFETPDERACVWFLAPGTSLAVSDERPGEFLQYRISLRSLEVFAMEYQQVSGIYLGATRKTADPVVILLSRIAKRLLGTDLSRSEDGAGIRYFVWSFYSHLVASSGACEGQTVPQLTGGLSPRHKLLVERTLSTAKFSTFSTEELASRCGLSTGHFARAFRQTFGSSLHKHVMEIRMERATRLLVESELSLKEVALDVGYADQATFTESFKRIRGVPPGRFRRKQAAIAFSRASESV